jgi:CubicO group peptidase (beta-lactamase class C family)
MTSSAQASSSCGTKAVQRALAAGHILRHPACGSDEPMDEDTARAGDGAPSINRRALLGLAAGSAAVFGPLAGIARPDGALAVITTSGRMARDLAEFERRCDFLRQALAIPGMSIAVVQAQELVLARGFGIVNLAEGTPAEADTPYPVASLTKDVCRSGRGG